ncbi:MAG: bifunctional DNA-formamidopyrimidine glycosylase/DNA-(apurinic or apyrimidinic site) lyase [Deltaproteobacteria bacterium]|nr:bifunctional DNA-formamidopyrimidine glycosylase/DNA-(apurinic or apyrimidinic site) lyase [Deltaproteobacteria bacterium]
MPELPEVETLCRQLRQVIIGATITKTRIIDAKLGTLKGIAGKTVSGINRHGKALAIELAENHSLVLHFRMTGRLLWQHNGDGLPPHTRLVISSHHGRLSLIDPRRFATVTVHKKRTDIPLGSDPLDDGNASHLGEMAQHSTLPIKSFLMDQRRIRGIGNIYACEILHQARMDPWRRVNTLSPDEWHEIAETTQQILTRAISCRGTSVSDWRDLFGKEGEYQGHLRVYSREGAACYRCGEEIKRKKLSGRGTYYCPTCQQCEGG